MKQVLCLSHLIDEKENGCNAPCVSKTTSTCVGRKMMLPDEICRAPERSRCISDPGSISRLLLEDATQKNTFIHYEIPRSPSNRPPTPTSSAPSILLSRLFKTKAEVPAASSSPLAGNWPPSKGLLSKLKKPDVDRSFDRVSEASTSAAGSVASSPVEIVEASPSGFATKLYSTNPEAIEAHSRGQCTPCNYFLYKTDGCRQGSQCAFCHICPKGEIKKRKKDKLKQLRKAGMLRR